MGRRPRPKNWTDRRIINLYEKSGKSIRDIARSSGLSYSGVHHILSRNNVALGEPGWAGARNVATQQRYRLILAMLQQTNLSQRQIAARLGVDRKTVTRAIEWGRQS